MCIVVNKQTESHKVLIFYLHEVKSGYNGVRHSPPNSPPAVLLPLRFLWLSPQPAEIDSPYPSLNTALLASQPYTRRSRISRLAPVLKKMLSSYIKLESRSP